MLKENILPDAKPGDVEDEVKDQLGSANARVVIEELVSIIKTHWCVMSIFGESLWNQPCLWCHNFNFVIH
jgi:hypothetical protein